MVLKTSALDHLEELIGRHPHLEDMRKPLLHSAELICECAERGGKVLVCGNGGSASDSEHIVGELMKSFILPRKLQQEDIDRLRDAGYEDWESLVANLQRGIAAVALTGHPSLSTAVLNDTDPYMAFAQQVYVLGRSGDVLIGISTSGNARNVVNAVKVAKAFGVHTIGFTGCRPSQLEQLCSVTVKAPETETFKIQECHLPAYHTLCLMVEEQLFGE